MHAVSNSQCRLNSSDFGLLCLWTFMYATCRALPSNFPAPAGGNLTIVYMCV